MSLKRLLPKTLLGRTVLVLILTVALTQIATQLVFSRFVTDQFARTLLRVGSNNLVAIGLALRHLPADERAPFARSVSEGSGFQVVPVAAYPAPAAVGPALSGRLQLLDERLRERLGPGARVYLETAREPERIWVRLPVAEGDWWVRIERTRFDRAFPLSAGVLLACSVLLAVCVAWLTQRKINQPLRAVQGNILQLSRGGDPPPVLAPEGPAEIRDLAEAVNRMAAELRRAEHERALLLAGVSHDLRTPLSRLRLMVEMLTAEHSQDQQALVQDIEEIDRIIGQFLDFARDPDAVAALTGDLSAVARDCAARSASHQQPVETQLTADLLMPLRRPALDRMINNLIENAWQYAGAPIEVHTAREPGRLILSVLDRGPGIPPEQHARLLQPFTRLDASRTGPAGAGLGLAIVDRIARSHGGTLELRARAGGGLEARVSFPAPD